MTLASKNKGKINQKGFTLIEVVLVLAIGGLIFLLAFLGFRQLQKNRRDTKRRSDLNLIVAQIEAYKGDTGTGSLPPSMIPESPGVSSHISVFASRYISNLFDPTANNRYYNQSAGTGNYGGGVVGAYQFDFGSANGSVNCQGVAIATPDKYVIRMNLESGRACRDNS